MCPWFSGGMFMMIMMAIFWGLILWGGYTLIRKLMQSNQDYRSNTSQSPLGILKQRYAKGEINQEEFERMKKDIDII